MLGYIDWEENAAGVKVRWLGSLVSVGNILMLFVCSFQPSYVPVHHLLLLLILLL